MKQMRTDKENQSRKVSAETDPEKKTPSKPSSPPSGQHKKISRHQAHSPPAGAVQTFPLLRAASVAAVQQQSQQRLRD